jgi:hypothetical protein
MPSGSSGHFEMNWLTHARSGTFGFDLGISTRGLVAVPLQEPFVDHPGTALFGDHASWKCCHTCLPGYRTSTQRTARHEGHGAPLSL